MTRVNSTARDNTGVGMKIYSLRWLEQARLTADTAAKRLRDQGIGRVFVLHGMMASSGHGYDPLSLRRAIADQGMEYWSVNNQFFDLELTRRWGNIPVDQFGRPAEQDDWYLGACPTDANYVRAKGQQTLEAVEELAPDGVFLGFHRFPGFWETWVPERPEAERLEFCFCPRCLRLFSSYASLTIPQDWQELRNAIRSSAELGQLWAAWKASVIGAVTEELGRTLGRDKVPLILNTVPFAADQRKRYFGQDVAALEKISVFELMAYHQVLKQRPAWVLEQTKGLLSLTTKPIDVTIQGFPLYLSGVHAAAKRKSQIPDSEWHWLLAALRQLQAETDRLRITMFEWGSFLTCQEVISRY